MADIFNAATYLITANIEAGHAGRVAVLGSEALTYGELDARTTDLAAAYQCLGLRRDDRVMIVMSDDVPMLTAILGAFRAGLVAVPVSTMFNGSELGSILADSGARALLCSAAYAAAAAAALPAAPGVEHVVLDGDAELPVPPGVRRWSWTEFASAAAAAPAAARDPVRTKRRSDALGRRSRHPAHWRTGSAASLAFVTRRQALALELLELADQVRVDVDAVVELLVAEPHDERHNADTQCLRVRGRNIRGAVGDEVDRHSRDSTYG